MFSLLVLLLSNARAGDLRVDTVAGFRPDLEVARVPPTSTLRDLGPGWEEVVANGGGGRMCDVELQPDADFVAGGWGRGAAMRHLSIGESGEVEIGEGGVLGKLFDEHVREYDSVKMRELVEDYRGGYQLQREMKPEFLAKQEKLAAVRAEQRDATGRHEPIASGKHNPVCDQFVGFISEQICEYVRSGAVECLGRYEDVVGTELEPWLYHSLTVEPTKPRLCAYFKELNIGLKNPQTLLEGLSFVRENCVRTAVGGGRNVGKNLDEKSGYHHHPMSADCCKYMGFQFGGFVFKWKVLTFGLRLGTHIHQSHGMLAMSFARRLGVEASMFIDDHAVVGWRGSGREAAVQSGIYVLLVTKSLFGYSWSNAKCALGVALAERFLTLGLVVDRKEFQFDVPESKVVKYVALGEQILAGLRGTREATGSERGGREIDFAAGWYVPAELGKYGGSMMSVAEAVPFVRLHLNGLYATLSERKLFGARDRESDGPWWKLLPKEAKQVPAELVGVLISGIERLQAVMQSEKRRKWIKNERAPSISITTDASLWQAGGIVRRLGEIAEEVRLPGEKLLELGLTLPAKLLEMDVRDRNMGVAEFSALYLTFVMILASKELVALLRGRHVLISVDNMEVYSVMQSCCVGGLSTVEKLAIVTSIFVLIERLNVAVSWMWVRSEDNEADLPSRALRWRTDRVSLAGFLRICAGRERGMQFTMDLMSSRVAAREVQVEDGRIVAARWARLPYAAESGWDLLPYFSLFADGLAQGVDGLAYRIPVGTVCWCFPNEGIVMAALMHLMDEEAVGVIVLRRWREPLRPVEARFRSGVGGEVELLAGEVERRTARGWEAVEGDFVVYAFNFRAVGGGKRKK